MSFSNWHLFISCDISLITNMLIGFALCFVLYNALFNQTMTVYLNNLCRFVENVYAKYFIILGRVSVNGILLYLTFNVWRVCSFLRSNSYVLSHLISYSVSYLQFTTCELNEFWCSLCRKINSKYSLWQDLKCR